MRPLFAAAVAGFALTPQAPATGLLAQEPVIAGTRAYYAPSAPIGDVDARLLASARSSIDMAAYVLTDRALVSELGRAAMRGVHVRVYLDGEQMGRSQGAVAQIAATPNVELRAKRRSRDPMHLKSFVIDRRVLRSGSANFSVSGEEYQDNDLFVIESPTLAARFTDNFERLWARADNQRIDFEMSRAPVMVLGAGAWGVALANVAASERDHVALWGHDPAHVAALAAERENKRHLPGLPLTAGVAPTSDLAELARAEIVLAVVPAQAMRSMARRARPFLRAGAAFVVCAKGIERGSHKFMSEVIAEEAPLVEVAVLSGPSFAADVCKGLPTAVTLASRREETARRLSEQLSTRTFRLYRSTDLRGVEIGGAAKNVLAIACGMAAGRELGASAGAALIARGFAELARLGSAWGARQETLMGLSGLGDLVLTCGSTQSRNFSLGLALGRGEPTREASHGKLAEGAYTASALVEIARERRVEMPIAEAVDAILAGRLSVEAAIDALLMRPLRAEA